MPVKWNGKTGENIAWKTAIPGAGHASPIIWNDRIFTVSTIEDKGERVLFCLNRDNGAIRWRKTVFKAPLETIHRLNSRASSTPSTDGKLVYATFLKVDGRTGPAPNVGSPRPITPGTILVVAYDLDGKLRWKREVGEFISAHGFNTCPVLYKDLVIINGDHDGDAYIVALERETGKERWRIERENKTRSYVTPIIREIAGRTQMVLSGSKSVASYDPSTGRRHWVMDGPTEQFVASMVYDGKLFFMAAGFPTYHVMGIRPGGQGTVTQPHVAWHARNAACYVPSPVVLENRLFVADDRGTANCYDATTGKRLWKSRLGKHYSASLISGGGKVYFLSDDGITKIVAPAEKLEVLAENRLFAEGQTGEFCSASPALSGGQLFVRTNKHLFCIGKTAAER